MQDQVENIEGVLSMIKVKNDNRAPIITIVTDMLIGNVVEKNVIQKLWTSDPADLFIMKEVHKSYDIFRIFWNRLTESGLETQETLVTEPLISTRNTYKI